MVEPAHLLTHAPIAELQEALDARDRRSLVSISQTPSVKLYTIHLTLDPGQHPHHMGQVFILAVDTGGRLTWMYGHDFQQIPPKTPSSSKGPSPPQSRDTCPWPSNLKLDYVEARRSVIPVHSNTGAKVPFRTTGTPGSDEWQITYGDTSSVYLRHLPESVILTNLPCWSWERRAVATMPLRLPCVLAFGANDRIIKRPYDGIIGLAVPDQQKLSGDGHVRSMAGRNSFIDALESPTPHVYEPRRFLIKLNHPDKHDICRYKDGANDFLSFGKGFPCSLKPTFTSEIIVYGYKLNLPKSDKITFNHWMLALEAIALVVPTDTGFSEFKIPMVFPTTGATEGGGPQAKDPHQVYVVLDTGSYKSYLPEFVTDEIRDTWLLNTPDILGLGANRHISSYCGPERNLDLCDIVFTFKGYDDTLVDFRCAAKPFFKSPTPLPSEASPDGSPPSRFCTNVSSFPGGLQEDRSRPYFVLGINFYWSAFIEHCGPDPDALDDDYRPSVRLAPQRALQSDGTMGEAEDFRFFPNLPPRFYVPPRET